MKKSRSIFIVLCSLFCLAAKVIASQSDGDVEPRKNENLQNVQGSQYESSGRLLQEIEPFPGVYYTDAPSEDAQSVEMVTFVNEIDFQGAEFIEDFVRVSYLVRDQDDKEFIENINPYDNMNMDVEETENLQGFVNMPTVAGQSYDTIDGYPCYRSVDGMFDFMDDLVASASEIELLTIEKFDIGDSYEKTVNSNDGDDIFAIRITGEGVGAGCMTPEKGVVLITCGIHAREYSPPELCARWIEALVDGYGNDADITSIVDHTEIHVILESNPDGRRIAETNRNLFWRKNTRPGCSYSSGRGVDLNRNFPFKWGFPGGSSTDPCSATYRGSSAASEPEIQAIIEYADSVFPEGQRQEDPEDADLDVPFPEDTTVGVFMDIHSYSELIIWPYAYEERYCPNEQAHNAFARKLKYYNNYALAGPFQPDFLYPASGVTDDFFYKAYGAASLTYELGTAFYQDCSTSENTIFPDNIPSLMYFAKVSTKPYSLVKGPDLVSLTFPGVINFPSTSSVTLEATVSDSFQSAGPGNYETSTQNIATITYSFDMHPYDVDPLGNGPNLDTLPVTTSSTTVTSSKVLSLSAVMNVLIGSLNGEHTIYIYATDEDGYDGPVTATSFILQNVPDNIPDPNPIPQVCLTSEPSISLAPSISPSTLPSAEPSISIAPSAAPTTCEGDDIVVSIRTDNYPGETSYVLDDLCRDVTVFERPLGYYTNSGTLYVDELCTAFPAEYLFRISDTWGDGICCGYGNGFYEVTLNGDLVAEGGNFGSSESTTFGSCDPPPEDCTDSPLLVSFQGSSYSCAQIEASDNCSIPAAQTHCPNSCDTCDTYACSDSTAPWGLGSNVYTCAQLADLDDTDITLYCSEVDGLSATCRDTCGFCNS